MKTISLLRKPEFYLGLFGLSVAIWFAFRAAETTSPGPLSAVHAQVPELVAEAGCVACHGNAIGGEGSNNACLACHEEIVQQNEEGRGLHSTQAAQVLCGTCHAEHQGASFQPVNDTSFEHMGIADPLHFDHKGLDFQLEGAHLNLQCALCHENAKRLVLEPDQTRFIGLRQECVACHEDVHEGSMGADCASCHGQEGEWNVVPFFEHTERFALSGVHSGLACAACHGGDRGPDVTFLTENPPEIARDCAVCHESPHNEPFAQATAAGCIDCHSTEHPGFASVEEDVVRSVHDRTEFELIGPHTEVACDQCHGEQAFPGKGVRNLEGVLAQALSFDDRHPGRSECVQCHADPHGSDFDRGSLVEVMQGRSGCVRCHSASALTWAPVENFEHGVSTGFDLVGAHEKAECTVCHKELDGRRLGGMVFPGQGDKCSSCHEDPHSANGRGSVLADLRCIGFREGDCHSCHNQVDFKVVPDFDHSLSGWPLEGAHQRTDCLDCHGAGIDSRLGLARAGDAVPEVHCVECHEDPHGQRFDGMAMPQVLDGREGCARCHGQESFNELPGGRFDHGLWTAFELVGSHQQVRCTECHGVDESGNLVLGKFESYGRGDPRMVEVSCEVCHETPHGDSFRTSATPPVIDGKEGCARCHGELTFRETPAFRHEFTGHNLEGAHADLSCVACHGAHASHADGARKGLSRLLPAAGRSCADCHADPHAGQFRDRDDPSCSACHTDQTSFLLPLFDHAQTRFPLDEIHGEVACATCHVAGDRSDGKEVIRYKPLGIDCVDCHGSVEGGPK